MEIEGGSDEEIKLISVPLSIIFIIGGAAAIASAEISPSMLHPELQATWE